MSLEVSRALTRHLTVLTICAGAVLIPGVAVAQVGNAASGQQVYLFETFGNEGFWTDAVRMPQGMKAARFTLLDALKLGLNVDADVLPLPVQAVLAAELRSDRTPRKAPFLNTPSFMDVLLDFNAIIGLVAKDSNGDGRVDIRSGDKVGVAALTAAVIAGQIAASVALDHFGAFGLDVKPVNWSRVAGAVLVIGGAILAQRS